MNDKNTQTKLISEITINYSLPQEYIDLNQIESANDAFTQFLSFWPDDIEFRERVYTLFLNNTNKILGYTLNGIGTSNACLIDVKHILQTALKANANALIIAHNHPTKTLMPSDADNKITKRMKEACEILDIRFLDHLIISKDGFYSYSDNLEL